MKHPAYSPSTRLGILLVVSAMALCGQAATKVYTEAGGRVVIEAEHYSAKTDDLNDPFPGDPPAHWHIVPSDDGTDAYGDTGDPAYANARGGEYIQSLPNSGDNHNNATRATTAPYVDYYVEITTVGTYQLWLRWSGYSGDSDSLYGQILEIATPSWYRYADGGNPDDGDFATKTGGGAVGWDGIANPGNTGGGGGEVPAVFTISAPGIYTIRLSMREDASAIDALILQLASQAPPTDPGPPESSLATQYLIITQHPKNATASIGQTTTFSVTVDGTGTITYQWQKKATTDASFSDITAATGASHLTPAATLAMNGTQYRVVVSNGTKTVTSSAATLITDSTPPELVFALGHPDGKKVTLTFSERLDAASAAAAGNYQLSGGLAVGSATLSANGSNVVLATSVQTAGTSYTVTVNGVKDLVGNTLTGGSAPFQGADRHGGGLRVDLYRNIPNTPVADLLADPDYPDNPDDTFYWQVFGPFGAGNPYGDNYGGRVTGWIVPPSSGEYKFYLRSDDASELYLGTGSDPATLQLIAEQTGCCNPFVDQEGTLSSFPINLIAGQPFALMALWKEGGGDDYLQVAWRKPGEVLNDPSGLTPIPAKYLETIVDPTTRIQITQEPANANVAASSPVSFSVRYLAMSAFGSAASVQWQKKGASAANFVDIPGATAQDYAIQFADPADNGARFRANVSVSTFKTVPSAEAVLTVGAENPPVPPKALSASGDPGGVTVAFDEPLDTVTATDKANYTIGGGVTVNSATVVSGPSVAAVVRLATTGAVPGQSYVLTINNVKDKSLNPIAADTKLTFTVFHINANFDSGEVPAGVALTGSANVKSSGSYNGSGHLELTTNSGSLQGSANFEDALGGGDLTKFTATFKLYIGNGSGNPADGFSFNIASDLGPTSNTGEEGTGSGLTIALDTYDNGGGEAPAIDVKWAGNEVATTKVAKAILVNNRWVDVTVQVDAQGGLTFLHDNIKYYDKLDVGWSPITAPQITLGARTGGETARHLVDDFAVLYNADVVLPEPPTITITAPTDGATLTAGQSTTLTVNAADPEGQIVSVEYFANGVSLGKVTAAPYSLTLPSVPAGYFAVTARVVDGQGLAVTSAAVRVTVRPPTGARKVLYVHAGGGPNASDILFINYLFGRGLDVVTVGDTPSQTSDADGKALIVISSTVGSGNVGNKFTASAVPLINWENALEDNLLMTLDSANVTRGTLAGQTQLEIVNPGHALAAGLQGVVTVSSAIDHSWGLPAGTAIKVAKTTDGNERYPLYAYEQGALLIDGATPAPARRIQVFLTDNTYAAITGDGQKLIAAAVDWALGESALPKPQISVSHTSTQITITWTNGGTLEKAPTVTGNWTSTGDSDGSYTESLATGSSFFRVRR
jgi:hypothetical protein